LLVLYHFSSFPLGIAHLFNTFPMAESISVPLRPPDPPVLTAPPVLRPPVWCLFLAFLPPLTPSVPQSPRFCSPLFQIFFFNFSSLCVSRFGNPLPPVPTNFFVCLRYSSHTPTPFSLPFWCGIFPPPLVLQNCFCRSPSPGHFSLRAHPLPA